MDPSRFDDVLRTLAAHRSRRALVTTLGATLVATLLGRAAGEAQDVCLTVNQKCKPRAGNRPRCCTGLRCHKKRCRRPQCRLGSQGTSCGDGALCCGGFCLDVRADPSNCGACGRQCLTSERCLGGSCVSSCLAGLTNCGGTCVDVLRNPAHCGGCNVACGAVATLCVAGQCSCPGGLSFCNGACVDTQTEPAHCGSCGNACRSGQFCQGGTCVDRCLDDGQTCQTDAQCCRFPESVCLNLGVVRVCGRTCVGASSQCLNSAPGPFCCSGLTCVGGRCTQDQQPPCRLYGTNCGLGQPPCCDGVPCNGGLCRYN